MRFTKPALCILLALFISIIMPVSAGAVEAPDPSPRPWDTYVSSNGSLVDSATEARAAILVDPNTGKVLYEKNADMKLYPASITKIMTCLLVLEHSDDLNAIVKIGDIGELDKDATKIGIQKGDAMSVEELLYGLMLISGNDAAIALAQYASGSVEEFANLMNSKCAELGMNNTHFVNPHGLHDDNHYTTARDMAKLAMEARKYPKFQEIVSTAYHTASNTDADLQGIREWENSNRLILPNNDYAYEFATGVKTGYTSMAQHTLVASAKKDDFELLAVVLEDTKFGKWIDVITTFLYGYEYYSTLNLMELLSEEPVSVDVANAEGGERLELAMIPEGQSYYTGTKQEIEELRAEPGRLQADMRYDIPLEAPIAKDTPVGYATFSLNGEVVMTCRLLAANDVEAIQPSTPEPTQEPVVPTPEPSIVPEDPVLYIAVGLVALLILVLVIILIMRAKYPAKSKKHAQRYSPDRSRRRHW